MPFGTGFTGGGAPILRVGPQSYLTYAAKGTTDFKDMEEDFDGRPRETAYYYKITTMDRNGYESAASPAVAMRSKIVLPLRAAVLAGQIKPIRMTQALTSTGWVLGDFTKAGDQILFKSVPNSSGLRIRYSNGNKGATRCGLYVNEKRVATLNFPATTIKDGADNYADGKRLSTASVATGDWNTFEVLPITMPVAGNLVLKIDQEDAAVNNGECCRVEQLELEPAGN